MADLTADLFLSLDGFAAGVDVGPFFGYGGPELDSWVHDAQTRPQLVVMGRVTYEVMAQILVVGHRRGQHTDKRCAEGGVFEHPQRASGLAEHSLDPRRPL